MFVFPRVHMKQHFLKGVPEGSIGFANKTGRSSSDIFFETIKHVQTSKENPALILIDNHETYRSLDVVGFCRNSGIILLTFPPNTTDKLQSFAVAVFSPFKMRLEAEFNRWHSKYPGSRVTIVQDRQKQNKK